MNARAEDVCQIDDSNQVLLDNVSIFPSESLRFPLDSSMRVVFTGYFNGFSVEVRSADEAALLYHMGCFGKGSLSRSKPKVTQGDSSPTIMRKRQFLKRNYWYKKFGSAQTTDEDIFLKNVDKLAAKIVSDSETQSKKDVIDLVSSDEDTSLCNDDTNCSVQMEPYQSLSEKEDVVVIVPNSDSEEENYFANLEPKCCLNKIKLQERLMLTLQEAFFLLYGLGCLQVVNSDGKLLNIQQCWDLFTQSDQKFIPKYVVYHYYRSKGYVVKPGIKFGGDYLIYREGPGVRHADYIVVIRNRDQNSDWLSILGHVRMAATTVKEIIIAEVMESHVQPAKLPENLNSFSVREILLTRKNPVTINDYE